MLNFILIPKYVDLLPAKQDASKKSQQPGDLFVSFYVAYIYRNEQGRDTPLQMEALGDEGLKEDIT